MEGHEPSADGLGPDRTTARYSHRTPARMSRVDIVSEREGPASRRPFSFVWHGEPRIPPCCTRFIDVPSGSPSTMSRDEGVERRMRGVRRSTSAAAEGRARHRHRCATSSGFTVTGYRRRSVNVLWIRLWKDSRLARTETSRACLPSQAVGPLTMAEGGYGLGSRPASPLMRLEEQIRLGVVRAFGRSRREPPWVAYANRNVMMVASCPV